MSANRAHIALKIAVACAPSVDVITLFESIPTASTKDRFDRIKLGELEALLAQKNYVAGTNVPTITTTLHALSGQSHYHAMQEVLLRQADGILFIIDLDPAHHQANLQVILHTSQTLRHHGSEPEETPMVFLYMTTAPGNSKLIEQWDQLLEIERNQWPRLIVSYADTQPLQDAVDLLTGKIISLPRLRVIA